VIACVSKHDAYCEVEHLRNRAVDRTDLKECKPNEESLANRGKNDVVTGKAYFLEPGPLIGAGR
jgi:hypothetical protein